MINRIHTKPDQGRRSARTTTENPLNVRYLILVTRKTMVVSKEGYYMTRIYIRKNNDSSMLDKLNRRKVKWLPRDMATEEFN